MTEKGFILKSLFGIGLILISSMNLFCQNDKENKNEWRLTGNLNVFISYNNSDLESVEFGKNLTYNFQVEDANPVNLGIGIKKINDKGWFQEYSITSLNVKKDGELVVMEIEGQGIRTSTSGRERTSVELLFRWEYGKLFPIKGFKKLSPGIGLSLDPFFRFNRIEFSTSQGFPFRSCRVGGEIALIPRIQYRISDRFSFVVKIPVGLNSFYLQHSKIDNSILAEKDNSKSGKLVNRFGVLHFQSSVGISFRI